MSISVNFEEVVIKMIGKFLKNLMQTLEEFWKILKKFNDT